jgi:transcription termination factor Rho
MSGEQQLERSVLEGKEREELHAIADAIGLKPSARASKATLVGQILKATGVDVAEGNGSTSNGDGGGADQATDQAPDDKPRRSRAVKPKAAEATNGTGDETGDTTDEEDGGNSADPQVGGESSADAEPEENSNGTEVHQRDSQGDRPRNDRQGGQGSQGGQGQGNRDRFEGNGGQPEPGNRRNRRRRGRERGDRPERELQGQGQGQGQEQPFTGEPIPVTGLLDLRDEGFGFLRTSGYLSSPQDVYVSISQVRRFALRKGDYIDGASRPAGSNEKYPALLRIDTVSGLTPDEARQRPKFEDLTPLFPDSKLKLEMDNDPANMTARIVDLISPIGKGQRGLIVSPPKAGKTTVMKQIAHSIEANNPDVHLMVLLVDERPEEVTMMRRAIKGEVVGSTFDRPSEEHTQVAELTIERAKRLVEMGNDVVIILDGITRLARAYNLAAPASGRILSGGIDTGALYPPKKFFGAARNLEEGGSLTILATALVETGSKMDEVIFEEFKGTGNMELRLNRHLAERRVYPAIDVNASSTRHEELLFDRKQLELVWRLRRVLNGLSDDGSGAKAIELLFDKIKHTRNNDEFLADIAKAAPPPIS